MLEEVPGVQVCGRSRSSLFRLIDGWRLLRQLGECRPSRMSHRWHVSTFPEWDRTRGQSDRERSRVAVVCTASLIQLSFEWRFADPNKAGVDPSWNAKSGCRSS